jgi:hypothetical protein
MDLWEVGQFYLACDCERNKPTDPI